MQIKRNRPKTARRRKALAAVATAAVVGGAAITGKDKAQHVQVQQAEQSAVLTYELNGTATATVLPNFDKILINEIS